MWLDRTSGSLYGTIRPVSIVLHGVGAGVLTVMMLLTASDVTLRQFKIPIMGMMIADIITVDILIKY